MHNSLKQLFHVNQHLVLRKTSLRKLEIDTTASQFSVNLRVGIESVINTTLLLLVEDNLEDLAAIFLGAQTLANNLDRVDQVGENSVVDGGQCSGTGSLLGQRGSGAVAALGTGQDAAGGEDEDMTVGELLLEFTGETIDTDVSVVPGFVKESKGLDGKPYRCCTLWKP